MVFVAKVNDFPRLESSSVVSNDFLGAAKSRKDIGFKELYYDRISRSS